MKPTCWLQDQTLLLTLAYIRHHYCTLSGSESQILISTGIITQEYTPISHNIMITCLILCLFHAKNALTHRGIGSITPLKMCCGFWQQKVSNRPIKSCKYIMGPLWIWLVCSAHRTDVQLDWDLFFLPWINFKLETPHKSCSFGVVLTQLSSHHSLALAKVSNPDARPFFQLLTCQLWGQMFTCCLIHPTH